MAPKQAADTHRLLTSVWWPHSVVILGWQQGFAETPKGSAVGRGESRMGTSRCGLSVKLEASGLNAVPSLLTGVMTSVEICGLSLKVPILY